MLFVDLICQVQDHRKKQKISPEWLFSVVLQREPYFTEIKDEVVYSKLVLFFLHWIITSGQISNAYLRSWWERRWTRHK